MPRLQPQHNNNRHHHHSPSPAKPINPTNSTPTPTTPLRPKTKQPMTRLLYPSTTTPTKKTSSTITTPHKPSTPKPNPPSYRKHPIKSKSKKILTPNPSKNHGTLSLLSFYDLSAELYSLSSRSNPKLKPSTRRLKKHSNHHAVVLPQSSDSEEVHSIFLPFTSQHSSRSSTPTPTKACGMTPFDPLDHSPFILDLDDPISPSPASEPKTTPPRTFPTTSTPTFPSSRHHTRARSVASIFELDKSSKVQQKGVRDDWDMPTIHPPRDLTWQQREKKAPLQTHSSSPFAHVIQNVIQHDSLKSSTRTTANQPSKEASIPARHPKAMLARTSSAGSIGRLLPPPVQPTNPLPPYSARSDDESSMTWQQSIIRPLPKFRSLPASHSNHTLSPSENKSAGHKKNQGTSIGPKTPIKSLPPARKAGVQSAAKPKLSPPQAATHRRNSLSSGHTFRAQHQSDIASPHSLRSVTVEGAVPWKSFPTSNSTAYQSDLPLLRSNPLPLVGAQVDHTPSRRTKSHTHQPASLSNRKSTQTPNRYALTSATAFSNIPEPIHPQTAITPSKSRSTSEDLNPASPEKQFTTSALRVAFMYAGPQFHNSPCPAALPAPKFSFGSA